MFNKFICVLLIAFPMAAQAKPLSRIELICSVEPRGPKQRHLFIGEKILLATQRDVPSNRKFYTDKLIGNGTLKVSGYAADEQEDRFGVRNIYQDAKPQGQRNFNALPTSCQMVGPVKMCTRGSSLTFWKNDNTLVIQDTSQFYYPSGAAVSLAKTGWAIPDMTTGTKPFPKIATRKFARGGSASYVHESRFTFLGGGKVSVEEYGVSYDHFIPNKGRRLERKMHNNGHASYLGCTYVDVH